MIAFSVSLESSYSERISCDLISVLYPFNECVFVLLFVGSGAKRAVKSGRGRLKDDYLNLNLNLKVPDRVPHTRSPEERNWEKVRGVGVG